MNAKAKQGFDQTYAAHLKHLKDLKDLKDLKLKGLQSKTIDAYARAIRRIGKRFDG